MSQVYPETASPRKSKSRKTPKVRTSKVAPENEGDNSSATNTMNGGDETIVIANEASATISHEDHIINKVLEDRNPAFHDENEKEEMTLMSRFDEAEPSALHAEYAQKASNEEERLRIGFVDKNVVDEHSIREVKREEEKLKLLRTASENRVVANGSVIDVEEEHLRSVLNKAKEVLHEAENEEQRIDELLKSRQAELIPEVGAAADVEFQEESIMLDRAHIVRTTMEGETQHSTHIQGILERHNSKTRQESIEHKMNREVEDAKLRDHYARRATFQKRESELLLKQNTRKNLAAVDNKEGKLHFRTTGGVVQFVLNDSGDFAAQNNTHNLTKDFDYIHQRKRHIQNPDCVLQKDGEKCMLNNDSDYINVRVGVRDFDSFADATGTKYHNDRSDCSIQNVSQKHLIPVDASVGRDANHHLRSKDSLVENLKSHDLRLISRYQNHVRGHDLCPEGVFVQRAHKMHLPLAHTTEFRNSSTHFIPPCNGLINRCRSVDFSEDCVLAGKGKYWSICDNGAIVQKGMKHNLALTGSQDLQKRQYSIPSSGSQDENQPRYNIPENSLINRVKSSDIPNPGVGNVRNNTKHKHHSHKKYSPWKRNKFSLKLEGSLSHSGSFGSFDDANWTPCENNFELFDDLDIDDDYLNEVDSDEDV